MKFKNILNESVKPTSTEELKEIIETFHFEISPLNFELKNK